MLHSKLPASLLFVSLAGMEELGDPELVDSPRSLVIYNICQRPIYEKEKQNLRITTEIVTKELLDRAINTKSSGI